MDTLNPPCQLCKEFWYADSKANCMNICQRLKVFQEKIKEEPKDGD
jgi:hypothetical protein